MEARKLHPDKGAELFLIGELNFGRDFQVRGILGAVAKAEYLST